MKRIWRETLRSVTPYEAGKPLEVIQKEMGLPSLRRLSANENPLGPSPKVVEALRKEAERSHLYPDGGSTALREAIGRHLGISPDWMEYFQDGRPDPAFLERVEAVREVLRSGGRTLAQGAIDYLWGRSDKTIPIPGCRTVAQVEENAGALAYGPLTGDQVAEVDKLLGRL